jgi:hypothetical protein
MPLPIQIKEDLKELAKLAATVTEAHSSAIFLPTDLFLSIQPAIQTRAITTKGGIPEDAIKLSQVVESGNDIRSGSIDLIAVHSYSKVVRDARIQVGSGLVGWVSDQGRPIHLTPCDVASSAIGIYVDAQPVKSLVAVPISVMPNQVANQQAFGVLMCDSLRTDSFNNAQVKILEQIASYIHRLLFWAQSGAHSSHFENSWDHFKQKTNELGDAIGSDSIEVLRLRLDSFQDLEIAGGLSLAVQHSEQFLRLAQQALPPHFPLVRLPSGDVIIAVDNMMSAFFQQKLQTLANHLHTAQKPLRITLQSYAAKLAPNGQCNLDTTLQQKPLTSKSTAIAGGTRA